MLGCADLDLNNEDLGREKERGMRTKNVKSNKIAKKASNTCLKATQKMKKKAKMAVYSILKKEREKE